MFRRLGVSTVVGYRCYRRTFLSRCHYGKVSARVFEDENWLVSKPDLRNLPKKAIKETPFVQYELFGLSPESFYNQDSLFKGLLDRSIKHIYNEKVTAGSDPEDNTKFQTWLKLRDYLYQGLKDPKLVSNAENFEPTLLQTIRPTEPSKLVEQLLKVDKIDESVWKKLLAKDESITAQEKYLYLLGKTFDYIHGQEIVPKVIPTKEMSGSQDVDISNPTEWFPEARKMKRHIIMHIGPTNSGKTYNALQKLKHADRGYYAGPLRLLAREIYDRFQEEGVRCNLLTGEEVIQDLDAVGNPAGITSGTVEMVPLTQNFDVVVLDEIQMMADSDRGWAWTNALLGARAREIHLCGEKSTLPIIKKIAQMAGDKLTVNEYKRLGELEVETSALKKGMKSLRKGDCVVAFSKKKILDLKLKIERDTNLRVAVIYGSLPPETRIQQAKLFNTGEYDVLVASDAIGMGLNLSIDRVIFTTDLKFNGQEMVDLSSSNVKQIGGRAGRFKASTGSGEIPKGSITALEPRVLNAIRRGIEAPINYLDTAVIWPTDEICARVSTKFPPGTPTSAVLKIIALQLEQRSDKLFTLSDLKNRLSVLQVFEHMDGLPFLEKLRLSNAPVKDLTMVKRAFYKFCETIARRQTRGLLTYPFPFEVLDYRCISDEKFTLELYESLYNIIMIYFWLSNRYPNFFVDLESARDMKYFCEMIIFEKLDRLKKNPYDKRGPMAARLGSPHQSTSGYNRRPSNRRQNRY